MTSALVALAPMAAEADPSVDVQLRTLDARIATAPTDLDLRIRRVDLLLSYDRANEALDDLARLAPQASADARIPLYRARGYFGSTDYRRARDAASECLALVDADSSVATEAHVIRARARARLGQLESALHDYDRALQSTNGVELHVERGALLEATGRLDQAAEGYRAGLAAVGGAVILRRALIDVERRQGRFASALREVDQVIASARVDTEWLLRRAEILDASGRHREAVRDRQAALEEANRLLSRRPSARAHLARAEVLVTLNRRAEARHDLQVALARAPGLERARTLMRDVAR